MGEILKVLMEDGNTLAIENCGDSISFYICNKNGNVLNETNLDTTDVAEMIFDDLD